MHKYPKVTSPDKLPLLFEILKKSATPEKITYRYLVSLGLKSSKDRAFLPLLQFLNYIDALGVPTATYASIKDLHKFKAVLLEKISSSYKEIFLEDINAPLQAEETLASYFTKITGESFEAGLIYARTFLGLCKLAGFAQEGSAVKSAMVATPTVAQRVRPAPKINISINLPTTTDKKVYEMLFKHLKELLDLQEK